MSQASSEQPTGSQLEEADEELAKAVSSERKQQRRASNKASIARQQPLKVTPSSKAGKQDCTFRQAWKKAAGELSEEEQRTAVQQALEVFRQLPPTSTYAQHRIRVLEKALELLDKAAGERSAEEQDELQQLLSQLKI